MSDIEKLAFAQALYNSVGKLVSTKDGDSLRAAVDAEFKERYEQTGAKSYDVQINGQDVGTYSLRFSKEKPQESHTVRRVNDYEQLAKWFNDKTDEEIRYYVALNLGDYANYCFRYDGELPDGCEPQEIITAAIPKQIIGGLLKVDGAKVANAMKGQLGKSVFGLLGGGDGAETD